MQPWKDIYTMNHLCLSVYMSVCLSAIMTSVACLPECLSDSLPVYHPVWLWLPVLQPAILTDCACFVCCACLSDCRSAFLLAILKKKNAFLNGRWSTIWRIYNKIVPEHWQSHWYSVILGWCDVRTINLLFMLLYYNNPAITHFVKVWSLTKVRLYKIIFIFSYVNTNRTGYWSLLCH